MFRWKMLSKALGRVPLKDLENDADRFCLRLLEDAAARRIADSMGNATIESIRRHKSRALRCSHTAVVNGKVYRCAHRNGHAGDHERWSPERHGHWPYGPSDFHEESCSLQPSGVGQCDCRTSDTERGLGS